MVFFKKPYKIRRFEPPIFIKGYAHTPFNDLTIKADVQTMDDTARTTPDGGTSVQRIKIFCDNEILIDDPSTQQKADRLFFNKKWFECVSCKLSENTFLKHFVATFVECLDQEADA